MGSQCPTLTVQFTRSPQWFADFGRLWYRDAHKLKDILPRVTYVERAFLSDHPADLQLRAVLNAISDLGIEVVPISVEEVWSRTESGTLAAAMVKGSDHIGAWRF